MLEGQIKSFVFWISRRYLAVAFYFLLNLVLPQGQSLREKRTYQRIETTFKSIR